MLNNRLHIASTTLKGAGEEILEDVSGLSSIVHHYDAYGGRSFLDDRSSLAPNDLTDQFSNLSEVSWQNSQAMAAGGVLARGYHWNSNLDGESLWGCCFVAEIGSLEGVTGDIFFFDTRFSDSRDGVALYYEVSSGNIRAKTSAATPVTVLTSADRGPHSYFFQCTSSSCLLDIDGGFGGSAAISVGTGAPENRISLLNNFYQAAAGSVTNIKIAEAIFVGTSHLSAARFAEMNRLTAKWIS